MQIYGISSPDGQDIKILQQKIVKDLTGWTYRSLNLSVLSSNSCYKNTKIRAILDENVLTTCKSMLSMLYREFWKKRNLLNLPKFEILQQMANFFYIEVEQLYPFVTALRDV